MIINCSEVADDESITGEQRDIDLEVQILAAKNVNPMKLVTLLRIRFGIGRYEIQVCSPLGLLPRKSTNYD